MEAKLNISELEAAGFLEAYEWDTGLTVITLEGLEFDDEEICLVHQDYLALEN